MRFKASIVAAALFAALAGTGQATVLPYKNFDRLVGESEGIVIGTVRHVEVAAGQQAGDLYTFVTVDQLDVISGQVEQGALTLRLKGGFDGRHGLHVEGAPQFAAGERVLLFVQGNGRDLVPFVGWGQGVFRLADEGGRRIVRDADGNAVLGLQGGHVQRRPGAHLETPLAGAPGLLQRRGVAPRAHGGTADNGSEVKEVAVEAVTLPAMDAERFVAEVRQRAGTGRALKSVTPQDMGTAADLRDRAPAHTTPAAQPLAQPAHGGVAQPMPSKAPAAGEQR